MGGCGVASLGVNNGVAGVEDAVTGGADVAIGSLGSCNGVDSGGRATGRT